LEAAARISVQTLMNSVNSLVAGMNQIKEEIRVLRKMRISPTNDKFIEVMEVSEPFLSEPFLSTPIHALERSFQKGRRCPSSSSPGFKR